MLYVLVDCNNFFVSCEKVFTPQLAKRPTVVLSNNDGCVIARCPLARSLGIPMGAPAFSYKNLFIKHNVHTASPNFSLYSDMSSRVMQILAMHDPTLEIYSIDEAFLHLSKETNDPIRWAQAIQYQILQWTGIPTSFGIAPTKTLAKLAVHQAKRSASPVYLSTLDEIEKALSKTPISDIWGIGRRMTKKLKSHRILTALAFKELMPGSGKTSLLWA